MLEVLGPNEYCKSIFDVDLDRLKDKGIKGLIVYLDNTLIARRKEEIPKELFSWLDEVSKKGMKVCIVSNNWSRRVGRMADKMKLPLVARAGKPRRKAFMQGMELLGTTSCDTAVIGDQLFTDVLGGNLLNLHTILVIPISPKEPIHTRILRRLERRVLERLPKDTTSMRAKGE